MRIQVIRRLAALVGAAIAAVVPASAAHAGEKKPLGNKWRVTYVKLGGGHYAEYTDGDKAMALEGFAFIRSRGNGKPFVMRLSDKKPKVITAPINLTTRTKAVLVTESGQYRCDYNVDNEKLNLVGVVWVSPNGVRVQWTLTPPGFKCPQEAGNPFIPQFGSLPQKATTTRFPVRKFTKKSAVVPIKITWKGGDLGWNQTVVWDGKVKFSR